MTLALQLHAPLSSHILPFDPSTLQLQAERKINLGEMGIQIMWFFRGLLYTQIKNQIANFARNLNDHYPKF